MISRVLSKVAELRHRDRYEELTIGAEARVEAHRISPAGHNVLRVGAQSMLTTKVHFERPGATLVVGRRTFVGRGLIAVADRIEIGDDVLVSWGVVITDHASHSTIFRERSKDVVEWLQGRKDWTHVKLAPVRVCDKAWLGLQCVVMKGLTIGEGAIVGAGAIVTRDVEPWTIVAGNPARVIRTIPEAERV